MVNIFMESETRKKVSAKLLLIVPLPKARDLTRSGSRSGEFLNISFLFMSDI